MACGTPRRKLMSEAHPRVLIPVHSGTWFVELDRVAELCLRSGKYEPLLLFLVQYPHRDRDIRSSIGKGVTCLDESGSVISSSSTQRIQPAGTAQQSFVGRL